MGGRTVANALARRVASGESLLMLFGLGPKGLPEEVFEIAGSHFDVTGRGKSLETCTAIGSVVGSLSTAVAQLVEKRQ